MKVLLDGMLPRFLPGLTFLCIPHEGKQDLVKSVPRKLRAWREPGVRFVVVLDNDGGNCLELKGKLSRLCKKNGREDVLIRIACQELEAWYLGEPEALADGFDVESLRGLGRKARFRDADTVPQPSTALQKLIPEFQKVSGARRMASHLSKARNRSTSFQVFISGVERLVEEMCSS